MGDSTDYKYKFQLHPDWKLADNPEKTPGGRAFVDWPTSVNISHPDHYCNPQDGICAGGPTSYVLRHRGVKDLMEAFLWMMSQRTGVGAIDIWLRDVGKKRHGAHFVAADPPLCMEYAR